MNTERPPTTPSPAQSATCDSFTKFVKKHREFTTLRHGDVKSMCVLALCESTSEAAKLVPTQLAPLQREYPTLEYEVVCVDKDAKLAEIAKKEQKKIPMALIICAGVIRKTVDLTSCSRLGELCKKALKGEDIDELFGADYCDKYHLRIADIYGCKKPDYYIDTMTEFVEMFMRIRYDGTHHSTRTCCILFYDDAGEEHLKAKTKFDQLRMQYGDVDMPAVRVDKDQKLRAFACSQGRRLPAVMTLREGEVVHVGVCEDVKKYATELKKYLCGEPVEKAFSEYNGERCRIKMQDQYVCENGLGEINEMPIMVDFIKNVKCDGHLNRYQRVFALMYLAESANDVSVFACRTDYPIQFPTVDFVLICGDEKKDTHMYEMIKKKCDKTPAALCIEGGRVTACVAVSHTEDFKHKITRWAQGSSAHEVFANDVKSSFKCPISLYEKKPCTVDHAHSITAFAKLLKRIQQDTEKEPNTCGAVVVCDINTSTCKEIKERMELGLPLAVNVECGIVDVSKDSALKKAICKNHEMPCLFAVEDGKVVGTVTVKSASQFVDCMTAFKGPGGSAIRAFAGHQSKMATKLKKVLNKTQKLKGRDAPREITEYGAFLTRFSDMFSSRSDEHGLGVMVVYREMDKELKGFETVCQLIPESCPKVEYALVNVSDDAMMKDALSYDLGPLPALILFEYGQPCVYSFTTTDEMARAIMDFMHGEKVGSPMDLAAAFGGDMALPSDKQNQPIMYAGRKKSVECETGCEGFKDLFIRFCVEYKKPYKHKILVIYDKSQEDSLHMQKMLFSFADDYPSLQVGLVNAHNDAYMKALCVEIGCELPMMVVYDEGRPKTLYPISDAREFSEQIEKMMSGEKLEELFVTPGIGCMTAERIVHAVYHLDAELQEKKRCEMLTCKGKNVLFMKGSRRAPECKFSRQVIEILEAHHCDFVTEDILRNPRAREELKKYANWPTFPQLYHNGEFIGGADTIRALAASSDLADTLE